MTMTRPTTEQITHNGQLLSSVLDRAINVLDYGAKGDGVTDDMDALIAAFNAVKAAGGGTLYIPNTPNGYYLRYGAGCNLGGTSNISIVSDGATLKLQGGTYAQAALVPVFGTPNGGGANNLLITGLRFVSASTVLRYGNGLSFPKHFDDEVDLGRADPNEQCSFRNPIAITGSYSNVTIDSCYFGPGLYTCIQTKQWTPPEVITQIRFSNLTFEGICSQSFLTYDNKDMLFHNIKDLNHRGSKFDWTLYIGTGCTNIVISDVVIKKDSYAAAYGCSAIGLDAGQKNVTMSNIQLENIGSNPFVLGGGVENLTVSNFVAKRCGGQSQVVSAYFGTCTNVVFDGVVMSDCHSCFYLVGCTNFTLSNFSISNSTLANNFNIGPDCKSVYITNGQFTNVAATATSSPVIRVGNHASSRNVTIRDVDFVWDTYVPLAECVDVRGAATTLEIDNCTMVSRFGSVTGSGARPLFSASGAKMIVGNVRTSGYAIPITYANFPCSTRVPQLPTTEIALTANSATPSVLDNNLFVTANTSATAYTNFTDGVQGQDICIRVTDANTTFDFSGSNLKGNNGVDYVATSGDLVFAKLIGSNWYCTVCEA